MDHSKYHKNPYKESSPKDFLNGNQLSEDLLSRVKSLDSTLSKTLEDVALKIPKNEYSVYVGYPGIAYLYLLKYKKSSNNVYLHKAKELTEKAIGQLKGDAISFLLGDAGPLTLGALIYSKLDQADEAKALIKRLLELPGKVREPPAFELLFGHAGYLFALLYLNKELGSVIPSNNIKKTIQTILENGKNNAKRRKFPAPLFYEWSDTNYLGAAHGVSGILYVLLCANEFLTEDEKATLIKPTIDWLSTERFPSGNFKSSDSRERDALIHWCHGSPGVIYLYILASKIFNDKNYLNIALQSGDVVWDRGLLQKGYSICHGASGNAYAFIHLYKATNDPSHLHRAACFADWCTKYPQAEGHKPDAPYSLFEGIAGLDYFLTDVQDLPNAAFPAFALN